MTHPTRVSRDNRPSQGLRGVMGTIILAAALLCLLPPSGAMASTSLQVGRCATGTAATTLGTILPGNDVVTGADCSVSFGSDDATATLTMSQGNGEGSPAFAPPKGALDSTFGTSGVQKWALSSNEYNYGVAIEPSGKIVTVGELCGECEWDLARLNADGSLDATFGTNGHVASDIGTATGGDEDDTGVAVAVQADGKIVAAGYTHVEIGGDAVRELAVARYLPDGTLDPAFGKGGIVYGGAETMQANKVLVQPDGKILVGGYAEDNSGGTYGDFVGDLVLMRLQANGELDRSFGANGYVFSALGQTVNGMALQPDGKIDVASPSPAGNRVVVIRFLANGKVDTGFATSGVFTAGWSYSASTSTFPTLGLAVQPDGDLDVAGNTTVGGIREFAVAQLTTAGKLNTAFGSGGVTTIAAGSGNAYAQSALVTPDRSIVVSGIAKDGSNGCAAVARLTPDGDLDTSFGDGGVIVQSSLCDSGEDAPDAIALTPSGAYVQVGAYRTGGNYEPFVLQYEAANVPAYSGSNTWAGTGSLFGVCLNSVSGAGVAPAWTPSATNCAPADDGAWRGVPATTDVSSLTTVSATPGTMLATANFRFGARVDAAQTGGAYSAPISFEVTAPNLTPPANTVLPAITGTAVTHGVLSADKGSWTGTNPISYGYQWQRCASSSGSCSNLAGSTDATYTPITADLGQWLRVVVTATNSVGSVSAASDETTQVGVGGAQGAIWASGFEHGTISNAGGGIFSSTGNAQAVMSPVRSGNYSLHVHPNGATHSWAQVSLAGSTVGVLRTYIYLASYPTIAGSPIIDAWTADGKRVMFLTVDPDGTVSNGCDDAGPVGMQTGAQKLILDHWYRFDMSADVSGSTWTQKWSIDGVPQPAVTCTGLTATTIDAVQFGNQGGRTFDEYIDDAIISNRAADYPIGPGHVLGYAAHATGTHADPGDFKTSTNNGAAFTALTAADDNQTPGSAALLDDWPVTQGAAADLVAQNTVTAGDFVDYHFAPTGEAYPPDAVSLLGAFRESSAGSVTATGVAELAGNTTPVFSAAIDGGTTTEQYVSGTLTDEPGGAPWSSPNDFNNLTLRISATSASPQLWTDGLLAEADFPTPDAPVNTALPTIAGSSHVGQMLSATHGTWANSPTGFTYQWTDCDTGGNNCTNIAGATGATYTLQTADLGSTIRVVVTAQGPAGNQTAQSSATSRVLTQASDIVYATGFESGSLSTNGGGIATALGGAGLESITTSHVHNGNYALRVAENGVSAGYVERDPASASGISVSRIAFMLESLPSAKKAVYRGYATSGPAPAVVSVDSSGVLTLEAVAGSGTQAGPTIVPWHWYVVDVRADVSSATWTADWDVDGEPYPSSSVGGQTATTVQGWIAGSKTVASSMTVDFDDWAISSASVDFPLGYGKVLGYEPTGNGDFGGTIGHFHECYQELTSDCDTASSDDENSAPGGAAAVAHWPISETPPSAPDGDDPIGWFIYQYAFSAGDYVDFTLQQSTQSVNPDAVSVLGAHRVDAPGGTSVDVSLDTPTGLGSAYTCTPAHTTVEEDFCAGTLATAPGGTAWTNASFNATDVRLAATGASPSIWTDGLIVEADYPEGAAPVNGVVPTVGYANDTVPRVGMLVTATKGTWSGDATRFEWQWQRCDASGTNCTDIVGATAQSYTVTSADVTDTLRVVVTAFNDSGGQVALSTVTPQVPNGIPAYTFFTGFEAGSLDTTGGGLGSSVSGAPVVDTAVARSGGYSMQSTCSASSNVGLHAAVSGGIGVSQVEMRVVSLPSANMPISDFRTASGDYGDVILTPTGQLEAAFFNGSNQGTVLGPLVTTGSWHLIDLRVDVSGATWTLDWRVDGVAQPSTTYAAGGDSLNDAAVGTMVNGCGGVMRFDDWSVSQTANDYPLPDAQIVAMSPASMGVTTLPADFQTDDAGPISSTSWLRLFDMPFGPTTSYIAQTAASSTANVEVGLTQLPVTLPNAYAVRAIVGFHASGASATTTTFKALRGGDTDATAPVIFSGNTSTGSTETYAGSILPPPGGGWTGRELDALRIRFGYATTIGSVPYWDTALAEVLLPG